MRDDEGVAITDELLEDLDARGLIQDTTDRAALTDRLSAGPLTLYCGFDPTADSLHVGSLLGLVNLRRFAQAGHRPLVLVGGATGMVGDPSGRSSERNLLDDQTLAHNVAAISAQVGRVLGSDTRWELVDNANWTAEVPLLDFLRDVGKHVTVNQMIARESVRARMGSDNGISFTEFTYQLLQANDFWWLHTNRDCELQVGGSDQWGNLVAGVDLIRRRGGGSVHALTWPLLLRSDGTKFGKSATGENVWLAPERTSPYRFFQFFMHTDDADVERLLLRLTLLAVADITNLLDEHRAAPGERRAQRRLAREVTGLVHGPEAAEAADAASAVLFGGTVADVRSDVLEMLVDEIPTWRVPSGDLTEPIPMIDAFVSSGLCASKKEARRTLDQGGGYRNDERLSVDATFGTADLMHGRFALLRRGRKSYALVVVDLEHDETIV